MRDWLLPLTFLYRVGSAAVGLSYRWGLRRPRPAPLPVISIGNISFGGSEKTPLAMHLIALFQERGYRAALVTRGYRGSWEKTGGILSDGHRLSGTWREAGDEPAMIARNHPRAGVFVGRDRWTGCRRAAEAGFDIAILDDGFQHRRLARELDIVLHQPRERIMLREFRWALRRAHVILTRGPEDEVERKHLARLRPQLSFFTYRVEGAGFFALDGEGPLAAEDLLKSRILAFSGIARPERFQASLASAGISPLAFLRFPDHHDYPPKTIRRIADRSRTLRADALLTTEKDAVKLRGSGGSLPVPLHYMKIALRLPEAFDARIMAVLREKTGEA